MTIFNRRKEEEVTLVGTGNDTSKNYRLYLVEIDKYDTSCTVIEKTLASVSENPEKLGYFLKGQL